MKYIVYTLACALLFVSCNEKTKVNKTEAVANNCVDLPESAATRFVPLLTDTLPSGVNAVYGVSSLLAWQQLKALDMNPLNVAKNYPELARFNASEDYKNTLEKGEYTTTVSYADSEDAQRIAVGASFSINLPFPYKFASYKNKLTFKDKKVAAFGDMLDGKVLREVVWMCSDLKYYNGDDDFVLELKPKDATHEILLCMLPERPITLRKAMNTVNTNVEAYAKLKKEMSSDWKVWLLDEDRILIPKLKFDYKSHHKELEGNMFNSGKNMLPYQIESFAQCIAFSLDEAGAKVYEQTVIEAAAAAAFMDERPKNLFFDKPFLIIIRHKGDSNPYFAAWIENTDFMQKE
nr:hypothetical protein [uncultured Flavobacterium sp.]